MKFTFKLKDLYLIFLKVIQSEPCTRPLLVNGDNKDIHGSQF